MKIKVGALEVLHSGSVNIERGKSFEFHLEKQGEDPMIFRLFLTADPNEDNYKMKPELIDNNILEINLVNFDHEGGGGGTTKPLRLGTFQNRALYFSFFLPGSMKGITPVFSYTFYSGENETENG